ncbi:MAG: flavodoxin [Chloroflexota bacterium]
MPTRFDESDPRYLVVYANDEEDHSHAEEITAWLGKWRAKMDSGAKRFGVILVNHVHEHDEDEEHHHERNEEEENAVTALATQFRREQRQRTNATTTGYASVYAGPMTDEQWQTANERTAQFAGYIFGIRGQMFKDLDSAKTWLDEVAQLEPLPLDGAAQAAGDAAESTTTAIFYGSTTGSTETIAEKLQSAWQATHQETPPIVNVGDMSQLMRLLTYNQILVGIPTWNVGKLQDDWEIVYPYLNRVDLSDKTIAIFGIGDQFGYPENFQDAVGILGRKFKERGATLVGYTSTDGYEHTYSVGVEGEQFMGLAIDDINQPEQTDERLARWVVQVKAEFSEQ